MKRTSPTHRRNRLVALSGLGLMMIVVILLVVLDLPDTRSDGMSGTMMANRNSAFSWSSGAAASSLDDALSISLRNVPAAMTASDTNWRLMASREMQYDPDAACTLSTGNAKDAMSTSDLLLVPRRLECLDAGPWHVFAVGSDGAHHKLDGILTIKSGQSSIELTDLSSSIGHDGEIAFEFAVHRPASEDGFDGVHDRPVAVWISNGKNVCVAAADAVSVPRSLVRTGKNWHETRLQKRLGLRAFKRVRDYDPFSEDGDIVEMADVSIRGDCNIDEGMVDLLIGPTERGYARVARFRVHAPPPRIDTSPIVISLPTGETGEGRFTIRNNSSQAASWSAEPADLSADEWLIGSLNQTLEGSRNTRGLVSFSAVDQAPGLYTSDIIVRVDDFYGTEVRIPVEMKVLPARASRSGGSQDADVELPGEFSISNYPNPFSAYTNIRLETREAGNVTVSIFDMNGRQIETLVDEYLSAGEHEFRFQADNLASGTYVYRVVTPGGQKSDTMVLVR